MTSSFVVDASRVPGTGGSDLNESWPQASLEVTSEQGSPAQTRLRVLSQGQELFNVIVTERTERCRGGPSVSIVQVDSGSVAFRFRTSDDCEAFENLVRSPHASKSVFDDNTDPLSATQYFHYYGQLFQQQNMLQDFVRTGTYQRAMLENSVDFRGRVVLDVGAGTGVLSFFALQAGAVKVYAVEASAMAPNLQRLAEHNGVADRIVVLNNKIENIELPEKVDILISEPMGTMLFNERMIETYLYARKWLKEDGLMFPSVGTLFYTPFCDEALFMELFNKSLFWSQHSFFGINLTSLHTTASHENMSQPVIDCIDPVFLRSAPKHRVFDFRTMDVSELAEIILPLDFSFAEPTTVHGIAFWFDVSFCGSAKEVVLSTSPFSPCTHWYQTRCAISSPILCPVGSVISGTATMRANNRQSYDITLSVASSAAAPTASPVTASYALKEPYYRMSSITSAAAQQSSVSHH